MSNPNKYLLERNLYLCKYNKKSFTGKKDVERFYGVDRAS